ncbi:MAG TPA: hypothetical protein VHG08_11770 [Longimicrobium sp.]|nr:hypothetical protein [Longimicrobium sp.]
MPVVINEFEVVGEAPPTRSSGEGGGEAGEGSGGGGEADASEIARLLRGLEVTALRVWAH